MTASKFPHLDSPLTVPEHVAIRTFDGETVALNVETGRYFGLNAVAARMLEAVGRAATPADVVEPLAAEYEQPVERIAEDLSMLLGSLLERGLLELDALAGA